MSSAQRCLAWYQIWLGTIQKAQAYASGHRLTVFEKMDPRENEVKIVDNLTVIREWLERQPRTYPSE